MATSQSIPLFPADEDRNAFGHYLSGLTDGEGCFTLFLTEGTPCAAFHLHLRADDEPILRTIQAFWQAGFVGRQQAGPHKGGKTPMVQLTVSKWKELATVVIPHFLAFPLRAKKRHDFALWRESVLLALPISLRPRKGRGAGGGTLPKWQPEEVARFTELRDTLRASRAYNAPEPPIASAQAQPVQPGLFDRLA